jgi:hypothetical protein
MEAVLECLNRGFLIILVTILVTDMITGLITVLIAGLIHSRDSGPDHLN